MARGRKGLTNGAEILRRDRGDDREHLMGRGELYPADHSGRLGRSTRPPGRAFIRNDELDYLVRVETEITVMVLMAPVGAARIVEKKRMPNKG